VIPRGTCRYEFDYVARRRTIDASEFIKTGLECEGLGQANDSLDSDQRCIRPTRDNQAVLGISNQR
jgi:hypothetical protein